MVLIGSYSVLNKTPGRWVAGSVSSENRSNWGNPGSIRNIWIGSGFSMAQSHPCGYEMQYSLFDCPRSGGIASRNEATGVGGFGNANLAGGVQVDPAGVAISAGPGLMVGSGGMLIYTSAPSSVTASGTLAGDILGIAIRTADLSGFDVVFGSMTPVAALSAALTATGDVTASLSAILAALADLTASGTVTSAAAFSLIEAVAAIAGSGSVSADAAAIGIIASALAASGNLTASMTAFGHFSASLLGSGGVSSAGSTAYATISAGINVTGDLLSSANVGSAVWQSLIEGGFSAQDILKILAAVAVGKTDIAVGGSTTVTFRDVGDTHDAVVATMSGSERAAVVLNP